MANAAAPTAFHIHRDDLSDPRIAAFLEEHLADMRRVSPPESVHALDLDQLRQANILFFSAWDDVNASPGATLLGTGAIKLLDAAHGEIKSMRTHAARRGQGLAGQLLQHLMDQARARGLQRLSLETGSTHCAQNFFGPARRLYERHGFAPCPPFPPYVDDPYSSFYTRTL
jgi:putative acetyltransferase